MAAEAVIRRKRLPLPLIDQPMAAGTEAVAGSVVATAGYRGPGGGYGGEVIVRLEGTNVVPVCQAN